MIINLKSKIWSTLHDNRRNKIVSRFARLCKNIHRATEHAGYDVVSNGEKAVLCRSLVDRTSPTIFDVGANIGDWTAMAHESFPDAEIYSFELSPVTAAALDTRFSGNAKIHICPFGLAAEGGDVEFFSYEGEASVLSGLRAPLHSHVPHKKESAKVRKGDDICRESGIGSIDYLKIDAEGADFEVISGFTAMLSGQKISVIQFELEGGRYLKDFYELLEPFGYTIGKLYSNHVDFQDHSASLEHSLGPNYIAALKNQVELCSSLKSGWKSNFRNFK